MSGSRVSISHLKALVERMGETKDGLLGVLAPKVRPLVSIEQFFKGSGGEASLWVNQSHGFTQAEEIAIWRGIRDREDVWDVLFSLTQLSFRERPFDSDCWMDCDHVVIITSADPADVTEGFPPAVRPTEFTSDSWAESGEFAEAAFVPSGMKPLWFFYD